MICDGSSRQFFMLLSIIKNGREMNKPEGKNRIDEMKSEMNFITWENDEETLSLRHCCCVFIAKSETYCVYVLSTRPAHTSESFRNYDTILDIFIFFCWFFVHFLTLFFPFPPHSFCRSLHAWTCQFLRLDFGCKYCRSARVRARERRRVRKVEGSQSQLVLLLPHYWIRWKWNEKIKFTFLAIHGTHIHTQCQHQGDLEIG